MAKTYERDGHIYSASNHRLQYDPELHENHNKAFEEEDLIYLCGMYHSMKKSELALALGRTHATILSKAHNLKKAGKFDMYKQKFEEG